jgi:HAE1 family hydrophobic/amphiphilic exporter-1
MERTEAVATKIDSIGRTFPEVENSLKLVGFNFIAGSGSAYAMVILKADRLGPAEKKEQSLESHYRAAFC